MIVEISEFEGNESSEPVETVPMVGDIQWLNGKQVTQADTYIR